MPVTRLDHLVLTVTDLDASVAWYRDVAGMRHITFGEGRHALVFGDQKINLHMQRHEIEPHARRPTPGSGDLCFIVDEPPEALGRRLAELGGAYLIAVDMVQEFYEACRRLPTGSEETVQLARRLELAYQLPGPTDRALMPPAAGQGAGGQPAHPVGEFDRVDRVQT